MRRCSTLALAARRLAQCLIVAALPLSAASGQGQQSEAPHKVFFEPFGLDLSALDKHTRPQDDFFQYVNGAWIARTAIPADADQITEGTLLHGRIEARLRALLEAASNVAREPAVTPAQKAGAMYAAFMDSERIDRLGLSPIEPDLAAVRAAADRAAIARLMGRSVYGLGGSIFSASVDIDFKDTAHYVVYLNQAGLGMPDRDYYLLDAFSTERNAYREYVVRLLQLIGWSDPVASADAVVAFEKRLAKVGWTKAQQRDQVKSFNPMSPRKLADFAPGFPWKAFLDAAKLGDKKRLVVGERSAFPRIATIFSNTTLITLRAWYAFNIADRAAPYLSQPFQLARFEFRGKALEGRREMLPRWKRAITAVSGGDCLADASTCFGTLGWAVGQMYVQNDFSPQTKAKIETLVVELRAAFRRRIEHLPWMSATTKREALRKLKMYNVKVGCPDHPRDYTAVEVRRDDLLGDVRRSAAADWEYLVRRSGGTVDWSDWSITPQTDDAYNGNLNDIVFAAAVLLPPVFDPAADDAVNYGAVGFLIGHELTHGFDDQGRTTDATGALRDWWTDQDAEAFKARAARLGAQFAQFKPVPGMHIDPDLTMGENIADFGGLVIALDAYHASLKGKQAPLIDGLTGDQRFFMSFAQVFRGKLRGDTLRKQLAGDFHSPDRFRVLGSLPNVDGWYEAFDVKPQDRMYRAPKDRVRIW